jgi:hypothetical protein
VPPADHASGYSKYTTFFSTTLYAYRPVPHFVFVAETTSCVGVVGECNNEQQQQSTINHNNNNNQTIIITLLS